MMVTIDLRKKNEKEYVYKLNWYGVEFFFIVDSQELLGELFNFFAKYVKNENPEENEKLKTLDYLFYIIPVNNRYIPTNPSKRFFSFYFGNKLGVKFKVNENTFLFCFDTYRQARNFIEILKQTSAVLQSH